MTATEEMICEIVASAPETTPELTPEMFMDGPQYRLGSDRVNDFTTPAPHKIETGAYFSVTNPCAACKGEGHTETYQAWCTSCGRNYNDTNGKSELQNWKGDALPCGHSWSRLHETNECPNCEGRGNWTEQITIADLFATFTARLQK